MWFESCLPIRFNLTLWSLWACVKWVGSLSLATKARVSRTVRWGRRRSSWRTWAMLFFTSWGVLGLPLIRTWPDAIAPPSSRHVIMSSKDVLPQPGRKRKKSTEINRMFTTSMTLANQSVEKFQKACATWGFSSSEQDFYEADSFRSFLNFSLIHSPGV